MDCSRPEWYYNPKNIKQNSRKRQNKTAEKHKIKYNQKDSVHIDREIVL